MSFAVLCGVAAVPAFTVPDVSDLRPARQAENIILTTVVEHFGVRSAVISCFEHGTRRDDGLASAY
ncbi:XRE family transcriptional regulator [Streptomyces sp. BE147]|uniref:XRE family transcriptional regulator n=1 Tax=unclassified Streptomyces TaxID=2593676 RepID=UPI002E798F79|nr:XRE family transcriptional regulator [Streptomyces sp. BE147]MEE1738784.1 XRE family transcriptional regulator [Streptomyces sp. BE147]